MTSFLDYQSTGFVLNFSKNYVRFVHHIVWSYLLAVGGDGRRQPIIPASSGTVELPNDFVILRRKVCLDHELKYSKSSSTRQSPKPLFMHVLQVPKNRITESRLGGFQPKPRWIQGKCEIISHLRYARSVSELQYADEYYECVLSIVNESVEIIQVHMSTTVEKTAVILLREEESLNRKLFTGIFCGSDARHFRRK